jgi:hypothetical protein
MDRSYAAQNLIALPRLSAREVVVIITEIKTAARDAQVTLHLKALPAPIQRALDRTLTLQADLDSVLAPQTSEGDTQAKRKADRAVDNGWAALFAWLNGWCLLPPERNPHTDEMLALRDLVFGKDGLQFTQLPYKLEWHESKTRLDAIARDGHDKALAKLGGAPFLDHLKEANETYGKVLGITQVLPETTEADIRSKQLAAMDAMRVFVTRASAHADAEVEGSEALSEKLLAPIVRWESRPAAGDEEAPAPAAAPAPAPTAAPAGSESKPAGG